MLLRVLSRLRRCRNLTDIVVATTNEGSDDILVRACNEWGVKCFRGSTDDVLDRFLETARHFNADAIVRITSDCPFIDPAVVDLVVEQFMKHRDSADYVSNVVEPRTFPRGLDTEVFTLSALETAWREDADPLLREHVTQYFLRNPDRFGVMGVFNGEDLSSFRWTVDTVEDLEFARLAYGCFKDDSFSWSELIECLKRNPHLIEVNSQVEQKRVKPN
jgi:spore coat polysaccharide biosynthesis protein SpsF